MVAEQLGRTVRAVKHRAHAIKARRSHVLPRTGTDNHFHGREHTEAVKAMLSERAKRQDTFRRLAKDPEFQRRRRAGLYAKPNKEESKIGALLESLCPGVYRYVGDGRHIVDGLNPDFVSADGDKIVEFFGRSFHDPNASAWPIPHRSTEEGRREVFARHGYRLLVIWDNELTKQKRPEIEQRIREFTFQVTR